MEVYSKTNQHFYLINKVCNHKQDSGYIEQKFLQNVSNSRSAF